MSTSPCQHDCDFTDGNDAADDLGCCAPIPQRRECGVPVLPTPNCNEVAPITQYDPETEQFSVLTTLYDSECSAITDSTGSPILTLVG